MSTIVNQQVVLVSRPSGVPTLANFKVTETALQPLRNGEVLVRNLFMSVDPYMRSRMNEGKSYMPPFQLNEPLTGGAVGEVIESRHDSFKHGDIVTSSFGWREYFNAQPSELHPVNSKISPLSVYLGAIGMTGMTAWAGLNLVDVKAGDVIFITAAAGAVGNVAGQLSKLRGCRVIGSAGSDEKVKFLLDECGYDAAFNYKKGDTLTQLMAAAPDGIDVYFDNVGGASLEAALTTLRGGGRIIACGGISTYNDSAPTPGPTNLFNLVVKSLTMKGLIAGNYLDRLSEFENEMTRYYQAGDVRNHETVVHGIDHAAEAFIGLFAGANIGKMVIDLR